MKKRTKREEGRVFLLFLSERIQRMIASHQNEGLLVLAREFAEEESYRRFCLLREQGLRKEAMVALSQFVKDFQQRERQAQQEFVRRFFRMAKDVEDWCYIGMPYPLMVVVQPLLKEWGDAEEGDAWFCYWYGICANEQVYIEKALRLCPQLEEARVALINRKLYHLYYATHHLPDYYIEDGEEEADLAFCEVVAAEIAMLTDEETKRRLRESLRGYQELIENYVAWKASGHPDLRQWGEREGRRVDSGVVAVYYPSS